jgi:hypothetical protein
MQKITITRVYVSDKDKNGVPFVGKTTGKPYKKLALKAVEYSDKWLSGFQNKDNENWKEGDVVDVIIKQNGEYLNFETPKAEDKLASRLSALEVQVMNLTNSVAKLQGGKVATQSSEPTEVDIVAEFQSAPSETQPPF